MQPEPAYNNADRSVPPSRDGSGRQSVDIEPWMFLIATLGAVLFGAGCVLLLIGSVRAGLLCAAPSFVICAVTGLRLRKLRRRHQKARPHGHQAAARNPSTSKRPTKDQGGVIDESKAPRRQSARRPESLSDERHDPAGPRDAAGPRDPHRPSRVSEVPPPDVDASLYRRRCVRRVEVVEPDEPEVPSPVDFPLVGEPSQAARGPWYIPVVSTQPGVAADQARLGTLEVRAASIIGPGHRTNEPAKPRQDAYRIGRDTDGRYLIVAVADGMSDSRRSDHGATVAVSTAVANLRSILDAGGIIRNLSAARLFRDVAGNIVASAKERGLEADEVRTGLIVGVVAVDPDRSGQREAWFGHLADVSAWTQLEPAGQGWTQLAGDRKGGGLDANTLRTFLPYHSAEACDTQRYLPAGSVLAFLTDGVSDAIRLIPGADAWFARRWAIPPPLGSFILDVGFEARTHQDDRTAVVVWCDAPADASSAGAVAAAGARERLP